MVSRFANEDRRADDCGVCEHCSRAFSYLLVHNGFADTAYAYCDTCGRTAIVSGWGTWPDDAPKAVHKCIDAAVEPYLKPCVCGGRFRSNSSPRCPHCSKALSAALAATYLERNAPGTARGWRWQRNWSGLYAIVIQERSVHDPWRSDLMARG